MRNWVLAAGTVLATSLTAPALPQVGAQSGTQPSAAPPVQDKHWTYIALSDGVIGWQDGAITRDASTNTARLATFFFYHAPNELPSFAQLEVVSSSPDAARLYDFESRIVTFACAGDTLVNERGLFFSIAGDRPKSVATSEQQAYEHVSADIDATIRKSACESLNPADAARAATVGELINIAVALKKAAAAAPKP